jgi:lipoate-protein ligase A
LTDASWRVERATGAPAEVAVWRESDTDRRAVRLVTVTAPAVVLGSTQPDSVVDTRRAAAAGIDVVRRRSGGGAVLVVPGAQLWADVFVPVRDPLWAHDVGRAFRWLGPVWTSALGALDVDARWHDGDLRVSRWSRLVCFAGVGPGEVLVGGRKIVGISQRRAAAGAWFHCAVLRTWDADALLALLVLSDEDRAAAGRELHTAAGGVDRLDALEAAFLAQLETAAPCP